MRVLVDTNVLFYALNADAPQHAKAAAHLQRLLDGAQPWCLSWVNVYELLSLATHPGFLAKPLSWEKAWGWVLRLLESPSLEMLIEGLRHAETLGYVLKDVGPARGAFLHDCHLAALMREHDVKTISTADADFRKFRFLDVTDPTRD